MYQGQSKFSGNLHALRGLAAVSVIFFHAWGMNAANIPSLGWMNFIMQFGAGVTLFFILSGFSLSLSNYGHIDKPSWLRAYSIKRIARIIPVWYVFIAITWLNHYFHLNYAMPSNNVLFSIIPFYSIVPGREAGMVWAGWTIGVELMFYMIFPIMIVLFRNNLKLWGAALLALIAISLKLRGYASIGFCNAHSLADWLCVMDWRGEGVGRLSQRFKACCQSVCAQRADGFCLLKP